MKKLVTICLVVLFAFACVIMVGCKEKINQDAETQAERVNESMYDFMNDSNLPIELKEKLSSMLVALNTYDINSFYMKKDIQTHYDLITGKIGLCDNLNLFREVSMADIEDMQLELEIHQIRNFEDYYKYVTTLGYDLFDVSKSKRNFRIRSAKTFSYEGVKAAGIYVMEGESTFRLPSGVHISFIYYDGDWQQEYDLVDQKAYEPIDNKELPSDLMKRMNSMLIALNTCDPESFYKDASPKNFKDYSEKSFDLITRKIKLCDNLDVFLDWSVIDLEHAQDEFESRNIKSFEEFLLEYYYSSEPNDSWFDSLRPIREFKISYTSLSSNGRYAEVHLKEKVPNDISMTLEWHYLFGAWYLESISSVGNTKDISKD